MKERPVLPTLIASPQDLLGVVAELKAAATQAGHEAVKAKVANQQAALPQLELSPAAKKMTELWSKDRTLDQKGLEQMASELTELEKGAPKITVTLAAPPTQGFKQGLVEWCRTEISPDTLVNFNFNSTLLGGMVVRYGSHILDWSFRRQILANRSKFTEALRRV